MQVVEVLNFIKNYWVLITCLLAPFLMFIYAIIEATKCSLRNDILEIYDKCKDKQEITKWHLEAILHSFKIYRILKGNSFVESLVNKVLKFKVID